MPNATPAANWRRTGSLALAGAATACAAIAIAAAGGLQTAEAAIAEHPLAPALGFISFVEDETVLASTESEGGITTCGNLVVSGADNVNIHDASTFIVPGESVPSADGANDMNDASSTGEYTGGGYEGLPITGSGLSAFVIGAGSLVTVGAVAMFSSARRRRTDESE
jgi:hypothetical protein